MRKTSTIFISIIITLSLVLLPQQLLAENLEEKLDQVQQEKENTSKQIEQEKIKEQQYLGQIESVEQEMVAVLEQLEQLNQELNALEAEINKTSLELEINQKELKQTEQDLQHRVEILNNRVSSIYKHKDINLIEVVLNSESFMDFVSKFKMMTMIADQDAKIIQEVKVKRQAIINIKNNILKLNQVLENQKQDLESLIESQESKKEDIEGIYEQKKELLSETIANKNTLLAMEKQLAAKEAEIKKTLESYRYGNAPSGRLAWPTNGILISGFGYRSSPIFGATRLHSGVDIACDSGTPVIAADGGQVIQAAHVGGYGYSVLIYHGGGVATFYAHLSGFAVSAGQEVKRGQTIGYVGTTGWTTGPHLHFEVRVNGVCQNPSNYL